MKDYDKQLDPYIIAPHFSTKLFKSQINYIKKYYSEDLFKEICEELNVPVEYLLSDDNWISAEFNKKFAEMVRIKSGDDEIFRKIGYEMLAPENINHLEYFLLKIAGPFIVFKHMDFYVAKVNRICKPQVTRRGLGKYKIRVMAVDSHEIVPDFYPNMLGTLEAFGPFFDLKNLHVRYVKVTKDTCVDYYLEFSAWQIYLKRLMQLLILIGVGTLLAYASVNHAKDILFPLVSILNIALLGGFYFIYKFRNIFKVIDEFNKSFYDSSLQKNERLRKTADLVDRKNKEVNFLGTISQNISSRGEMRENIKKCLDEVKSTFNYEKIAILLNEDNKKGSKFYSLGFSDKELMSFESLPADSVFSDVLMTCPIRSSTRLHGVFIVGAQTETQGLKNDDKVFFENMANMLGLLFENEEHSTHSRQVAHDIRSPLSVLNMLLPSLNSIELAKRAVDRVTNIADDLLKKRNPGLNKSSKTYQLDIKSIFTEIAAEFAINHEGVEVDNSEVLIGTFSTRLSESDAKRIISNLFNNAVEATAEQTSRKIQVKTTANAEYLFINISDNGCGMSPDVLAQLGRKNFSFGKEGLQYSGAGLGVYHAKQTLDNIQGDLMFESMAGKGTQVTLKLPLLG